MSTNRCNMGFVVAACLLARLPRQSKECPRQEYDDWTGGNNQKSQFGRTLPVPIFQTAETGPRRQHERCDIRPGPRASSVEPLVLVFRQFARLNSLARVTASEIRSLSRPMRRTGRSTMNRNPVSVVVADSRRAGRRLWGRRRCWNHHLRWNQRIRRSGQQQHRREHSERQF